MEFAICSYSFHRTMAAGQMDFAGYVSICRDLGCAQLDPWNAHLLPAEKGADAICASRNPSQSQFLQSPDMKEVDRLAAIARAAGLAFGTMAVDGANIYEESPQKRAENRTRAYQWLEVAQRLGAKQVRIDAGGPEELPDDSFAIIVEGYKDLIERASKHGIEILVENHWGSSTRPENIERFVTAIPKLGLLFDTRNWKAGTHALAIDRCARFTRATHLKTSEWDAAGNLVDAHLSQTLQALRKAGYRGVWGIESVPKDGDEIGAASKMVEWLRRS